MASAYEPMVFQGQDPLHGGTELKWEAGVLKCHAGEIPSSLASLSRLGTQCDPRSWTHCEFVHREARSILEKVENRQVAPIPNPQDANYIKSYFFLPVEEAWGDFGCIVLWCMQFSNEYRSFFGSKLWESAVIMRFTAESHLGKRMCRPAHITTEGHEIDAVKEVAQSSLSSQSTVEWSKRFHDTFERCESIDTAEPRSPVSSGKSEDFGFLEEPIHLSKQSALELQHCLLQAFTSPGFQKKLHVIARRYRASYGNDPESWKEFKNLVRSYQSDIIPAYGFEASSQGVRDMQKAFVEFEDDSDVFVNAAAINEALFSAMKVPDSTKEDPVACIGFGRKPATKVTIMDLLQNLIVAFSGPSFQEEIIKLKTRANLNARRLDDPQGYYHLPGRAELALPLQQPSLKSYGFSGEKNGVREMVRSCKPYLSDPEVAKAFDAVNMRLGTGKVEKERERVV